MFDAVSRLTLCPCRSTRLRPARPRDALRPSTSRGRLDPTADRAERSVREGVLAAADVRATRTNNAVTTSSATDCTRDFVVPWVRRNRASSASGAQSGKRDVVTRVARVGRGQHALANRALRVVARRRQGCGRYALANRALHPSTALSRRACASRSRGALCSGGHVGRGRRSSDTQSISDFGSSGSRIICRAVDR